IFWIFVGCTGDLFSFSDNWRQKVSLVNIVYALQNTSYALNTKAGINVFLRQLAKDFKITLAIAFAADVLHEHEVPDFHVAVVIRFWAAFNAVFWAAVVVDLRARTTRAWHTHRPVVIFHPHALNAFFGNTDFLVPDSSSLIIIEVNSDPQTLWVKTKTAILDGVG